MPGAGDACVCGGKGCERFVVAALVGSPGAPLGTIEDALAFIKFYQSQHRDLGNIKFLQGAK